MKEQIENEMKLEFLSKSNNEAFARITVAAFVASLDPTIEEISDIKTCVSEYPFLTEKHLNNINKGIDIYYVSGSCESLVPTIFDSCVGCIETGETLKINGLVVLKELTKSKTVLICNYSINDKLVQSFINQMEGLL